MPNGQINKTFVEKKTNEIATRENKRLTQPTWDMKLKTDDSICLKYSIMWRNVQSYIFIDN